jgi:hypothetical protein
MRDIMVAMVSAKPGEEDEFNAWYEQHMTEVRAVPGIVSGQRYRLAADQAPGVPAPEHVNLAVYEIDGDVAEVLGEIIGRRARGEWAPRRGLDETRISMWMFSAVSDRGEPLG